MSKNKNTDVNAVVDLGENPSLDVKLPPKRGKGRASAVAIMLAGVALTMGADKPVTTAESAASGEVKQKIIVAKEALARTEFAISAANRYTCDIKEVTDNTAQGEQPQRVEGRLRGRVTVTLDVKNNPAFNSYRDAYNKSDEIVWGRYPRITTIMVGNQPLAEQHFDVNQMEATGNIFEDAKSPENANITVVEKPLAELRPLLTNTEGRMVTLALVQPVNKLNLDRTETEYTGVYPCSNGLVKHNGEWQSAPLDPADIRPFVITGPNPDDVVYGERQPA